MTTAECKNNSSYRHMVARRFLRGACGSMFAAAILMSAIVLRAQEPAQPGLALPDPSEANEALPGDEERELTLPADMLEVPGITQGMTFDELITAAQEAIDARQLDDGEKILSYLLTVSPEEIRAKTLMAYVCDLQISVMKAAGPEFADEAEQYQACAVENYMASAQLALERDRFNAAERGFKRVLRYEPANAEAKLGMARVYAATDRSMLAIETYRDYNKSEEGETNAQSWLELGQVYRKNGLSGQAISALQQAVKLNPENPDIHHELAMTYLDDNRKDEAAEAAQDAMTKGGLRDNFHKYVNLMARVQAANGAWIESAQSAAQAISLAREQLAKQPDDVQLLLATVTYHNSFERALNNQLGQMARIPNPDPGLLTDFRIDLARSMAERSASERLLNLHNALQTLPVAEGDNRNNLRLLLIQAELEINVKKLEDAAATCQRILAIDPNNAAVQQLLRQLPSSLRPSLKREAVTSANDGASPGGPASSNDDGAGVAP